MRGKLWLAGGPPDVSFRAFLRVGLVRLCMGAGLAGSIEGLAFSAQARLGDGRLSLGP